MAAVQTDALLTRKAALRDELRAQRRALDPAWVARHSTQAQDRLLALPEYAAAQTVGVYLGLGGEVETQKLITHSHQAGKRVAVPAFDAQQRTYGLVELAADEPLTRGPLAIPQPAVQQPVAIAAVDMLVVPGLAFDLVGGRLGQGGGHYDRLLAQPNSCWRVALAFEFQILDEVPRTAKDMLMHAIITEKRIIRVVGE
ncbi:MAG: 5-formyltetrahydrofolate cyclo-ligase [Verrucomicrobia bacterium]|nr:5-formyltetrahydrofolate cyclo-ligase [Verrucomicrobiota bacterium]